MLFVEARFFYFFAIVFAGYWMLSLNTLRKAWLLAASYAFYAAFFLGPEPFSGKPLPAGWWFPLLLMASTALDYWIGLRLGGARGGRKAWVAASIVVNIGVLAWFKYMGFFVESAQAFSAWLGLPASIHTLKIILPVGVSFYTFQSMSYTLEVYRGHREPERNLLNLATFIAFFPQLVAGPIVRASHLLPQFATLRHWADVDVRGALALFMAGFFKKACVSDNIAPFVDRYYANPALFDAASAWIAVPLYAVQIYCDFSGYTDMANAAARLLGYDLAINFNFPYFSRSVTEFWQRWHISLSTWLRDYLYISLGGNRGPKWFVYRNLIVTMLLGGLWHGSRWTFVVWGGLHGLALVVHREWSLRRPGWAQGRLWGAVAMALTFYFVSACLIFFRSADLSHPLGAEDFARALSVLKPYMGLGTMGTGGGESLDPRLFALLGGLALLHWGNFRGWFATWWRKLPEPAFALGYGAATVAVLLFIPVKYAPFIYFQF
ncbi:MAG: MBOAT family O-acyltransferase [Chthoniobacteraceae bacterium]